MDFQVGDIVDHPRGRAVVVHQGMYPCVIFLDDRLRAQKVGAGPNGSWRTVSIHSVPDEELTPEDKALAMRLMLIGE